MDSDGLPIVGHGVDFTKAAAINHERLLVYINHFVSYSVNFLNHFSCICEEKLGDLHLRIQRLETAMILLETKLASIPGLETVSSATQATPAVAVNTNTEQPVTEAAQTSSVPPETEQATASQESEQTQASTNTVSKDPRYAKYFKMLQFGVPLGAIQAKIRVEEPDLDASLLETPNAPAPPMEPGRHTGSDDSDLGHESDTSFSD